MYRWMKVERFAALVFFVCRLDGTATANLRGTLLPDLERAVKYKYDDIPGPELANFLRRYGRHVRRMLVLASGPLAPWTLARARARCEALFLLGRATGPPRSPLRVAGRADGGAPAPIS